MTGASTHASSCARPTTCSPPLAWRHSLSALSECLHANGGEHVVGRAQLLACVEAPVIAAQPLPVDQMRAGQLRTELRTAQPADRFAIAVVSVGAVAEQRPAARLNAEGDILAAG